MPLGRPRKQGDATAPTAVTSASASATTTTTARPFDPGEDGKHNTKNNNNIQKRKIIPTSDRYFLQVLFVVILYLFVIYQSLQFAGPSNEGNNNSREKQIHQYGAVDVDGPSAYAKTFANAYSKAYPNAGNIEVLPRGVVDGGSSLENKAKTTTANNNNNAQQQQSDARKRLEMRLNNLPMHKGNGNAERKTPTRKVVFPRARRKNTKNFERIVVKPIQNQLKFEKKFKPVEVLQVAPDKLSLPKPIINVGFPKAGTSTIFSFFHCNGLKAQHWFCCEPQDHPTKTEHQKLMSYCMLKNMISKRPLFQDCGDYDVYTEINGPRKCGGTENRMMLDDGTILSKAESTKPSKDRIFFPQHHQLDKIDDQYPNATLVLNHRSTKEWIASVKKWDIGLKYQILNEFYEQNSTRFLFDDMEKEQRKKLDDWYKITNATNQTINAGDLVNGTNKVEKRIRPLLKPVVPLFDNTNIYNYLEIVYNYHIKYIKDWVTRHPSHALVEVDITHEGAGKILAESFGLKEECWGHFNKNDHGAARRKGSKAPAKIAVSGEVPAVRDDSGGAVGVVSEKSENVISKQLDDDPLFSNLFDQKVERVMKEQTIIKEAAGQTTETNPQRVKQ